MESDDKNVEALGEVVETARGIIAGYRTDNTDLRAQLTAALARAEKAEKERDDAKALYAKAWEEIQQWRERCGSRDDIRWRCHPPTADGHSCESIPKADAHDAARKEAGL